MTPKGDGWHYLAVRKISALRKGITSKYDDEMYCLICLHSFKKITKECENKYFVVLQCLLNTLSRV